MKKTNLSQEKEKIFMVRLPPPLYDALRALAFKKAMPMAVLCREGLEDVIKKYEAPPRREKKKR